MDSDMPIDFWSKTRVVVYMGVILSLAELAGCASVPSYVRDNPRNMQNMTGTQLERELGKAL